MGITSGIAGHADPRSLLDKSDVVFDREAVMAAVDKMAAEINRVVGNLETEADLIASRVAALEEQLDLVKDDNVRSRTAEVRLLELANLGVGIRSHLVDAASPNRIGFVNSRFHWLPTARVPDASN